MGIRSQNNPLAAYLDVFSKTGLDAVTPFTPTGPRGHTATGGVISDYTSGSDVYRAHIFTSSGTFEVTDLSSEYAATVEFLLVAGGGGGGDGNGAGHGGNGGGGAGGYVEGNAIPVANPSSFTVTIGAGGNSMSGGSAQPAPSKQGTNSTIAGPTITTITAKGGGGGGEDNNDTIGPGGSGGGCWGGGGAGPSVFGTATQPGTNSSYGATDYGNRGGSTPAVSPLYCGSGGGGAGAAGGDSPTDVSGDGGAGRASTIAYGPVNPVTYAGGGGGARGSGHGGGPNGSGGAGGGGDANNTGSFATGGGGGGMSDNQSLNISGGSGIGVIRYQIGTVSTAKATGGAISFYGGKTIHTFTSTGTFTAPGSFSETLEYVIVGGGGAGGGQDFRGGGGGAGAVRHGTTPISGPSTTSVQVGAGGVWSDGTNEGPSGNGTSSYFGSPITSPGGGMGGGYNPSYITGIAGGSGGGAGGYPSNTPGGTSSGDPFPGNPADTSPANGWGYDGGATVPTGNQQGGGGGGAGGVGIPQSKPASPTTYGLGGPGIQLPATFRNPSGSLGTPGPNPGGYYVAGGGNGGGYSKPTGVNPAVATTKPVGGGGYGAIDGPGNSPEPTYPVYRHGHPGNENTGSGGGGCSPAYDQNPGRGGSGLVLIAYPT